MTALKKSNQLDTTLAVSMNAFKNRIFLKRLLSSA